MLETLKSLHENNIVQVYGMPGLGKSSLLKNATCFLGERHIFPDGIVYIDVNHVNKFLDLIQIINKYLIVKEDQNEGELDQNESMLFGDLSLYNEEMMDENE